MSKWSEELQEKTRLEVFPGTMMKDENHNYGFFFDDGERVIIKGIIEGGFMPVPSEEIIATFGSVMEMVDAEKLSIVVD